MTSETRLIDEHFRRAALRHDVVLGIGDDAALTELAGGMQLVSTTDTIVEGVHFPAGLQPGHIGYRALAVNLSDLAAMGAEPLWVLLSLSVPAADDVWLAEFSNGFFELAGQHRVALIGGDLVRATLSVTVCALGQVPAGAALTRSGARNGDAVFVTGILGAAALGLSELEQRSTASQWRDYFVRPQPRVAAGLALRGLANAAIDISDGLVTDAGRVAACSRVAIHLDPHVLPGLCAGHDLGNALQGGDDYELLFTADQGADFPDAGTIGGVGYQRIGEVRPGSGVHLPGFDLDTLHGYDHFRI